MKGDLACIALRTLKATIIPLQYQVVTSDVEVIRTSERLVTTIAECPANDKWLQVVKPVYYEQSDSLGKDLGPLKGVTGIM